MADDISSIIGSAAAQYGLDPSHMLRVGRIESSLDPSQRTGSYHGLFQLSVPEFQKYGGGNIYDPRDNARAAAAKMAAENAQFRQTYKRDPTALDSYLQHQQGVGGYAMHMANPDRPAWQNMYMTGEGQTKGPDWARRAIWGNVPKDVRSQYPGGVENLTSQQFMDIWRNKVGGGGAPVTALASTGGGIVSPSMTGGTPGAPAAGLLGIPAAPPQGIPPPPGGMLAQQQTPQSKAGGLLSQASGLLGGETSMQPVQPVPINFPVPPGLAMARAAAMRGMFGGGT